MTSQNTITSSDRPACSECQRRKQRCDRQWPCNHCQKRRVPAHCRFRAEGETSLPTRKRKMDQKSDPDEVEGLDDCQDGLKSMGYMASHPLFGLATQIEGETREKKQDLERDALLEKALLVLPPRPYTDLLMQRFVDNVNYHYYIVHPPTLLNEYKRWWGDRTSSQPLDLEWTCLLLEVCACATQYLGTDLTQRFQLDLGESTRTLTARYHNAAQSLSNLIAHGHGGYVHVLRLIQSCYWHKTEGKFVECWHVLNDAVREAQELGIHKEHPTQGLSEFDTEMRRRTWCILDTWDWQMSTMLSRPLIIDRNDCQIELPALSLDGDQPSASLCMRLQSQLIRTLFQKFGHTRTVTDPVAIRAYQAEIENWQRTFPPCIRTTAPDTSHDAKNPWLVLHRHYLYNSAYLKLVAPTKPYLARSSPRSAPEPETQIRAAGIGYALLLMTGLQDFFNYTFPDDARFHFVLFAIFDTATLMCSALLHDEDGVLPRRDEVRSAISSALEMLRHIHDVAISAAASYSILSRLAARVLPPDSQIARKKVKVANEPAAMALSDGTELCPDTAVDESPHFAEVYGDDAPSATDDGTEAWGDLGFGYVFDADIAQLDMPWDWQSLNLDFSGSP